MSFEVISREGRRTFLLMLVNFLVEEGRDELTIAVRKMTVKDDIIDNFCFF